MSPSVDDKDAVVILTAREFVIQQVEREKELRELSEQKTDLALKKQALEYERRLDDLNHAHARSLEDRAAYVQREIYEQTQKDFQNWKVQVTADSTQLAERLRSEQAATASALATSQRFVNWMLAAISLVMGLAGLLWNIFHK